MPIIVSSSSEGERVNPPSDSVMDSEVQTMTQARSPILEYATYNTITVFIPPVPPADVDTPLTTEDEHPLTTEDGHPIILDN